MVVYHTILYFVFFTFYFVLIPVLGDFVVNTHHAGKANHRGIKYQALKSMWLSNQVPALKTDYRIDQHKKKAADD